MTATRMPASKPQPLPGRRFSEDAGLLALRVVFGLSMAFLHGWTKLPVSDDFISVVEGIGIPFPAVLAWIAVLVEFLGGILICVGLFTRTAALGVLGTMLVAVFVRYAGKPIDVRELALLHAAACAALLLTGPGRASVDHALARRAARRDARLSWRSAPPRPDATEADGARGGGGMRHDNPYTPDAVSTRRLVGNESAASTDLPPLKRDQLVKSDSMTK